MEIRDTRNHGSRPFDTYSIEGVRVGHDSVAGVREWALSHGPPESYLSVSLKPEPQYRNCFDTWTTEVKKHGARELKITFGELQTIVGALKDELDLCYRVLRENDLLSKVAEARRSATQRAPTSKTKELNGPAATSI